MHKKVLQLMLDYMRDDNALAPDTIYSAVYELLCDNDVDSLLAAKIADAAFELASAMVADAGRYI